MVEEHSGGTISGISRGSQRLLILGSAPYVKDWWGEFGKRFLKAGFEICAINNAWIVVPDSVDYWFRSNDFHEVGSLHPTQEQRTLFGIEITTPAHFEHQFHWYRDRAGKSGTMLINALYYFINRAIYFRQDLTVAVTGSDFVYQPISDTHFYGKGKLTEETRGNLARHAPEFKDIAADPLRYGKDWLLNELHHVRECFEKEGFGLFNAGFQEESMLPFERLAPAFLDTF